MPILEVAFTYPLTYMPHGGRSERTVPVRATAQVSFADPGPSGCPLAVATLHNPNPDDAPAAQLAAEERYHAWAGGLVRDFPCYADEAGMPVLAPREAGDWPGNPKLFAPLWAEALPLEEAAALARKVIASGEAEALAAVHARADTMCLMGTALMAPAPEPVWVVSPFQGVEAGRLRIWIGESGDRGGVTARTFRLDRLADAIDHARWTVAHVYGLDTIEVTPGDRVRIMPGAPLRHDGLVDYGPAFLADLDGSDLGRQFHLLPAKCLKAWSRYREVAERAQAGDPFSLQEAFEALGTLVDALPAKDRRDDHLVLRRDVAAGVRAYRAFEADRVFEPFAAEDGEAIASLGVR